MNAEAARAHAPSVDQSQVSGESGEAHIDIHGPQESLEPDRGALASSQNQYALASRWFANSQQILPSCRALLDDDVGRRHGPYVACDEPGWRADSP